MLSRNIPATTLLLSVFAGCSDDPSESASEGLDDVVFVNAISDDALARMLEKAPTDVAAERLEIQAPSSGAELDKSTPFTFSWRATGSAAGSTGLRGAPAPSSKLPRLLRAIEAFVSPVSVAHAHGPTYNGTAYYLVFSTPSNAKLLRVFTPGKSYTPESADWSKLAAASSPVTLTISSARFENSLLTSDGGPFVGASTEFTFR